jgi:hypothetical protein
MARSEHVPISKNAGSLTVYREQVVRPASRYRKDTLGSDRWLQSREIGACPSHRSRTVNVGRAPRAGI